MLTRILFFCIILFPFIFSACRESRLASSYAIRNKLIERTSGDVDTVRVKTLYWMYDRKNRSYFEMAKFSYANKEGIIFTSDIFHNSARLGLNDKYEKVNFYALTKEQAKGVNEFIEMLKYSAGDTKGAYRVDYTIDKGIFISCIVENKMSSDGRIIPGIRDITLWMYGRKHQLNYRKFTKQLANAINKY